MLSSAYHLTLFSGEAYELPDTRMDLREPTLDVIEESGGGAIGGGTGGGAGTGSKVWSPTNFFACLHL